VLPMTHYARGTSITALTISLISASAAMAQLPPPPIRRPEPKPK
jgi:hypothetical protein